MSKLSDEVIRGELETLDGWSPEANAIHKQYTFASFPDAMAFLIRLAFAAEAADHHPDISVHYRRVSLTYSTHSEGGLTLKDFEGARLADRLAKALEGGR